MSPYVFEITGMLVSLALSLRPPDEGGIFGRGRAVHICGVLLRCVTIGEVSSSRVTGGSAHHKKTLQTFLVPSLQIQGDGGPIGDGDTTSQ